ncbi:GlxA family transcriptional regulator [Thalassotalea atypica]|uniref:GlxA family transcriptional regulator n=1 Tax=Thalassotalea atypica TaxID=2054316 RepID=UPI0025738B75|nr:helix-turn-helix domain-containing protein [Thalassotalea atypica]
MEAQQTGVCVVATDHVYGMGVLQVKDMLHSASLRLALQLRANEKKLVAEPAAIEPAFEVIIAKPQGKEIQTYSGTSILADETLTDEKCWRLVVLSHFWGETSEQLQHNPTLIEWLKGQYQQGAKILGMGSGVFWLAEAGLLDGKNATTYWRYMEEFKQRFPQVLWQENEAVCQYDDIACSVGVASASDILLDHIAELCGAKVAQGISRDILFDTKRSYKLPSFSSASHRRHQDILIQQIQQWLDENYAQVVEFGVLAERFGMSKRNFARRFKAATGDTPKDYLQHLRISVAKERLIYSEHSVKYIALEVGYQDGSYFCELFKRLNQLTPLQYRKQFKRRL